MTLFAVSGVITKAVHKSSEEEKKEEEVKKTLEQHDNIVTQYKELIREQVRAAKSCPLNFRPGNAGANGFFVPFPCSGCSNPGAERTAVVHGGSERANADDHGSAAITNPTAQRSVQHPQAEVRWVWPVRLWGRITTEHIRTDVNN